MELDSTSEAFIATVKDSVLNSSCTCLPCLIRSLHGCFPTTVLAAAKELDDRNWTPCSWHRSFSGWDVPLVEGFFPHVLDSDWRYSRPSVSRLLDMFFRLRGKSGSCLHVGSPSTYLAALKAFPATGKHYLYDRNALLHDIAYRHQIEDLGRIDAAIIDPPWYPDETIDFMKIASDPLVDGALVFIAQPGLLTRPEVAPERATILEKLAQVGYEHVATRHDFVRYETPHFEWVTLSRQTDERIPADWRQGDLLVFRFSNSGEGSVEVRPETGPKWDEVAIGPMRVRIRTDTCSPGSQAFEPVIPGGVAHSVSRRDPIRPLIGIWTTGNRVFHCPDPGQAKAILEALVQLMLRARLDETSCCAAMVDYGVSIEVASVASRILLADLLEHLQHAAV